MPSYTFPAPSFGANVDPCNGAAPSYYESVNSGLERANEFSGRDVKLHCLLDGERPVEILRLNDAIEGAGALMHIRDVVAGAMLIDCQQKGPPAHRAVDDEPKGPGIARQVMARPPLYPHRACDARKRARLRVAST